MSRHGRAMGSSPAAAHWAGIVVPAAQPASAAADAMVAEGEWNARSEGSSS